MKPRWATCGDLRDGDGDAAGDAPANARTWGDIPGHPARGDEATASPRRARGDEVESGEPMTERGVRAKIGDCDASELARIGEAAGEMLAGRLLDGVIAIGGSRSEGDVAPPGEGELADMSNG